MSKKNLGRILKREYKQNRMLYLMILPVILYYGIFHYGPMYGAQIAFKDFSPMKGILGSPFIGFVHFVDFFRSYYFVRLLKNTLLLNLLDVLLGFPAPIILALFLNELKSNRFKRITQTVTYLPHFISLVVICGFILEFLARDGLINDMLGWFGFEPTPFMTIPGWFKPIFVLTNIWQSVGWGSIIYLAALSAIDGELYEAAKIDGANRWQQLLNVTIPGIAPTIIIMLILRLGRIMEVGHEKVLLLYNPVTYESADVISTFVYRKGILEASYDYSTAVGLFNSVINFTLLVLVNKTSKRLTETSLW